MAFDPATNIGQGEMTTRCYESIDIVYYGIDLTPKHSSALRQPFGYENSLVGAR